jgi:hypothetical protein
MLFSASDNGDAKREDKAILACPWNQRLAVGTLLYDGNPSAPNIRHYSVSGDHTWFLIVVFVIQTFLRSRTV